MTNGQETKPLFQAPRRESQLVGMAQKQAAPQWTEASRIRLGSDLFAEAKRHIMAGEPIPELLSGALDEWQSEAVIMAGQSDIGRATAWWEAYSSMDRALRSAMEAREWNERMSMYDPPLNVEPPVPPEDFKVPEIPQGMDTEAYQLSDEAVRRFSIMEAPVEIDGERAWVTDSQGVPWELTDAMNALAQPEVREQLRQSLMGVIPGPPIAAHTIGAMPGLAQLPIEAAGRLGLSENRRNVPTAVPGLKLPWLVGFGPKGQMRGDEEELLRDPVWARALRETIETLDLKPTGWETLGQTLAFVADFAGVSKGIGLIGKPAMGLAKKAMPNGGLLQFAPPAMRKLSGAAQAFPGSSIAKTVWDFLGYETLIRATDDSSMTDDMLEGVKSGLLFGFAGKLAGAARSAMTAPLRLSKRGQKSILARMFPRMVHASEDPARRLPRDIVMEGVREFVEPTFSKTIAKLELAPYARAALKHTADAQIMGQMVYAYGAAQEAEPGKKLNAFWSEMFSTNAFATGLGFALNSALGYTASTRRKVLEALKTEKGKAYTRNMAEALGSPSAERFVQRQFELLDAWRNKEPDIFEGIVKMNPRAKMSAERTAKEDIALRTRLLNGDTSSLLDLVGIPGRELGGTADDPTAISTTRDVGRIDLPEDARAGFDLMIGWAERDLAVGAKKATTPEYTLGDWADSIDATPQLSMLGFGATKDSGVRAHALNAVNEYLMLAEGVDKPVYKRLRDVPQRLFRRVLRWRDAGKPRQLELPVMLFGAGENRVSLVDILRAMSTPPDQRLPRQRSIIDRFGEQLPERAAFDADMEQIADELEALRSEWLDIRRRGEQRSFVPTTKDAIDMLSLLRKSMGSVRKIPTQDFLIRGYKQLLGTVDALLLLEEKFKQRPPPEGAEQAKAYASEADAAWYRANEALRKLVGALDASGQAETKLKQMQRSSREAEAKMAEPGSESNLEAATKKTGKRRRRPLRDVIARILSGKMTKEEAAAAYPEGAEAIPAEGSPESWVGAFERAVREAWKRNNSVRLRSYNNARKDPERHREPTLREFVRKLGGLLYRADLHNLSATEIGDTRTVEVRRAKRDKATGERIGRPSVFNQTVHRRPIVHDPNVKKGSSLDDIGEAAWEAGYFAERPTERELIDALMDDIRHPSDTLEGERIARDREAEEMYADQLLKFREDLESGVEELPSDPAERRKLLEEVYSGDERFVGMDAAGIERSIMELRNQSEAGDLGGAVEPSGAPSLAQRAAAGARRLVEDMAANGLIDMDVAADSQDAAAAIHALAGSPAAPKGIDAEVWSDLVSRAVRVKEDLRDAIRDSMSQTWEAESLPKMEALWTLLDARQRGEEAPKEVLDELAEFFDEAGELKTGYVDRFQQVAYEALFREAHGGEEGVVELHAGLGVIPFMGRKFTSLEDNVWGRMFQWKTWLDRPDVQRFLGRPWPRKVFEAVVSGLSMNFVLPIVSAGPLSRPQSSKMRNLAERDFIHRARERARQERLERQARAIMHSLYQEWGSSVGPIEHAEFFFRGFDDGSFAQARGPEDFEAMRKGTGYLFEHFKRMRDLWEEIGQDSVALGTLTQAQLDKFGGGRYMTHYYVREQYESEAQELNMGQMPLKYQGRLMARENGIPGPEEAAFRPPDIGYTFLRGVHEETQMLRGFQAMRRLKAELGISTFRDSDVAGLGAYDRGEVIPAAVFIHTRSGESVEQAAERMAAEGKHHPDSIYIGGILTKLWNGMGPEDGTPAPGKAPYTKAKADLLKFFFGQSEHGRISIPKTVAAELRMVLQETLQPQDLAGSSKIAAAFDMVAAVRKRGLTILRPSNWMLQILSNVARNHVFGGVPAWDAIRGLAGLPSHTKDGIDAMVLFLRWMQEGSPNRRTDSWSAEEWAKLKAARNYLDEAGPATSTFVTLGPEFATAFGVGFESPSEARRVWKLAAENARGTRRWDDTQDAALARSIARSTNLMYRGLESVDARILKMLGENSPESKAKAFGTYTAVWNLVDIFFSKYPAFLKARHEWPDLPHKNLIVYSLRKTGNGSDTHPAFRSFYSKRAPWGDQLWRASQGKVLGVSKARAKLMFAQVFRQRFWMDAATSIPQATRSMFVHPLRTAASLAVAGAVRAGIMATMSDEERDMWREEAETARRAVVHWPGLNDAEKEAFKRLSRPIGWLAGKQIDVPSQSARDAIRSLWTKAADTFVSGGTTSFPGPKHGGESRIVDIGEIFPVTSLAGRARAVSDLMAFGKAGESKEDAQRFLRGAEQILGMTAQAGIGLSTGILTANSPMLEAIGGDGSPMQAIAKVAVDSMGAFGVMYPTLALFTREGQHIGEAIALGGQRWNDALSGIQRAHNPQDSGQTLLSIGARLAWPSRSVLQRSPLRGPVDGWSAILSELYPGFDATNERGRTKMRAHAWSMRQLSTLFADLYEQHFDEAGEPGKADWTLDERIRGALDELFTKTEEGPEGWRITPGEELRGALMQAIAGKDPMEQGPIIEHMRKWLSRKSFTEDGMTMLLEVGRRNQMPKSLFREAFRSALEDPSGTGLVKWWDAQTDGADAEALGKLSPLMWDVRVPPEGSDALDAYRRLMRRYTDAGYDWPPNALGSPDEVYRSSGQSRAVQGGQAFTNFIINRKERNPLESYLTGEN